MTMNGKTALMNDLLAVLTKHRQKGCSLDMLLDALMDREQCLPDNHRELAREQAEKIMAQVFPEIF
jgi:hypothetical protein